MPAPGDPNTQFIRLHVARGSHTCWWVIFDGSGKHRSFATCVARGPEWRGIAGRIHGSDNSFLAELWACIHAIRLIPYTDDAIIIGDCQGVLFRAFDGLPSPPMLHNGSN